MNSKEQSFSHKQMAVTCFNRTWEFLDKEIRTPVEEEEMIHLCHASFWHWTQVEDHNQQNLSIGYWQLSRVYAVAGIGKRALYYAERCVKVSHDGELAPFYIAYAYEARARAQVLLNQMEDAAKSLASADQFIDLVKDEDSEKLIVNDVDELRASLAIAE